MMMFRRGTSAADAVKLFAMANQLTEVELDRVEAEFGVDLGRRRAVAPDKDETYYPQFDERVRLEAAQMARHYEIFYALETTIRTLISDTLTASAGPKWWDVGRVPQAINVEVAKRVQREIDSGVTVRSEDPIDFTTFGELGEIIKANWDVFGSIFNSPKAVEKVMANLNTLRAPIAHCSPLAADEVLRLTLSVRDWFRLME
jgi:HEPN superfamily Swt1-like protein